MKPSFPARISLGALLLICLVQGCSSGDAAAPHLARSQTKATTTENCRPVPFGTGPSTPPDRTVRTCGECVDAPTIKTKAEIRDAGRFYLSTRNWNDAYVCFGALHLVYGNVGVTFDYQANLKSRTQAGTFTMAHARRDGGEATEILGYPAYKEDPRLVKQPVGAIVMIVVRGTLVTMQGNRAASLEDVLALAKTFQF